MLVQDSIVAQLTRGATVVTATPRLAREARRAYDQLQLDDGNAAWESADALPYDAFWRRAWSDLGAGAVLLDRAQRAAAWERIIRDDIAARDDATAPLWNPRAAAVGATQAWQMACEWRIDLDRCSRSAHDDHRSWLRWARRYQKLCDERNWIDPDRVGEQLCAMLIDDSHLAKALPQRIVFAGFDSLTPQQQASLDVLRSCGIDVENFAPESESESSAISLREYDDERAQWHGAACWARAHLQRDANARIAIVAPDLARAADAIDYALRQVLCPSQMIAPATRGEQPFHLSLGAPLSRYPPAQAALRALAPMSGAPMALADIEQLIRSPFLRGAQREASARERLAQRLRRRLPYQIRFARWLRAWADDGDATTACPQLAEALHNAHELLRGLERKHPASHWARQFDAWLRALGWPNEHELALDSDEFQAVRALCKMLRDLARLDLTAANMTAAGALAHLRRQCDTQIFQVEARDQSVQVLSVNEAAGQSFDALWLGNMIEDDWPPAQRVNPFIAPELQRDAGVIAASLETSCAHALAQQRRLLASAAEAVLSHSRVRDEVEVERSPLLNDVTDVATQSDDDSFDTPTRIVHESRIELESYRDERAPELADGAAGGGISVIENQAKCPFRAFAIHRLHARGDDAREPGLSPAERGSLLHHALQLAWSAIETSHRLAQLTEEQLEEILRDAATRASARHRFVSGCGANFERVQVEWICATLRDWFAAERARAQGFEVEAMEAERAFELAGVALKFFVDRIDRLDDGSLALIDYKTGKSVDGVGKWVGERPRAPQLPLYALAQESQSSGDVRAVMYGRVVRGDCGLVGISAAPEFTDGKRVDTPQAHSSLKGHGFDDWNDLVRHWRVHLQNLARAYRDGDARVDPLPDACTYCDLHSLCRVDATDNEAGDAIES